MFTCNISRNDAGQALARLDGGSVDLPFTASKVKYLPAEAGTTSPESLSPIKQSASISNEGLRGAYIAFVSSVDEYWKTDRWVGCVQTNSAKISWAENAEQFYSVSNCVISLLLFICSDLICEKCPCRELVQQ